jgi:hypothetical protein
MKKILALVFFVGLGAALAQSKVDQGKPGTQGPWPIHGNVNIIGNDGGMVKVSQGTVPWLVQAVDGGPLPVSIVGSTVTITLGDGGSMQVSQGTSPWVVAWADAGSFVANQGTHPWLIQHTDGGPMPVSQGNSPWLVASADGGDISVTGNMKVHGIYDAGVSGGGNPLLIGALSSNVGQFATMNPAYDLNVNLNTLIAGENLDAGYLLVQINGGSVGIHATDGGNVTVDGTVTCNQGADGGNPWLTNTSAQLGGATTEVLVQTYDGGCSSMPTTPLSGRRSVELQNMGPNEINCTVNGSCPGVGSGRRIASGGTWALDIGSAVLVKCVANTLTQLSDAGTWVTEIR